MTDTSRSPYNSFDFPKDPSAHVCVAIVIEQSQTGKAGVRVWHI